ncbi:MAG: hypothetical protein R3D62_13040 [Xanthobacteraceae bacterium]
MTQTLIDHIGRVSLLDGLVRIECLTIAPDGKSQPSGTLLMSGAQAGKTLSGLVKSLQELQKKAQTSGTTGRA